MPAFLVDENLPHQLVQRAHENGHEARWVRDIMPGASDREILRELLQSEEHLVTRDVRFANTVFARIGMEEALGRRAHPQGANAAGSGSLASLCGAGRVSSAVARRAGGSEDTNPSVSARRRESR